jgi:hypothetical protein
VSASNPRALFDNQGLSAFVRAGGVPNDRNLINFYAAGASGVGRVLYRVPGTDGGLVYKGLTPGRPNDKVGLAAVA